MQLFKKKENNRDLMPARQEPKTSLKTQLAAVPKWLWITGACAVVLAVGAVAAFSIANHSAKRNTGSDAEPDLRTRTQQQIYSYIDIARSIQDVPFVTYADTSDALSDFTEKFNNLSAQDGGMLSFLYEKGSSFARSAASDPYGTQYYLTAKKDRAGTDLSTYSFYMVSGGENKVFNIASFETDADDVAMVILAGQGTADQNAGSDNQSVDFGLNAILAGKMNQQTPPSTAPQGGAPETPDAANTLPARVTLTFNAQNGNGGATTLRVRNGNSMSKYSVDIPTRENYEFVGYYTGSNGTGAKMFDAMGIGTQEIAAFGSNATLYAHWAGREVAVHFDNRNGEGRDTLTARYGSTMPTVAPPTREGFYFVGYFSQENGNGIKYYDSNGSGVYTCDLVIPTTLYAYWSASVYTVRHYIMNEDGTYPATPTKTESIANSKGKSIRIADLVDQSYIVDNGIVYSSGSVNGDDSSIVSISDQDTVVSVYYARCKYKVTATLGEGIATVSGDGEYLYGQRVTLNAKLLDGYTWSAWRDSAKGDVVSTQQKYQFTMGTEPVSLEASTTMSVYTVRLDPNGGSCSTSSISVSYEENYYNKLPTKATRDGYSLNGWSEKKDSTDVITDGMLYEKHVNSTLYASWTAEEYKISFDFRDGKSGTSSVIAKYGQTLPSIPILPTRTGYSFAGYYSDKDGTGIQYYDAYGRSTLNSEFTSDKTLYAKWEAHTVSVSYYDQGGATFSGTHEFGYPTTASYGSYTSLKSATKSGYTFSGWYRNAACTGSSITSVRADSDDDTGVNLFAKWTPISVTLRFDIDNDDLELPSTLKPVTVTYGEQIPSLATSQLPDNLGYRFLGFYTDRRGTGTQVYTSTGNSAGVSTFTSNVTLYAFNEAVEVYPDIKITFDKAGGAGGIDSTNAAYGEILPTVSVPAKDGYLFTGYYTEADGGGTRQYNEAGTGLIRNTETTGYTLYANWEVDPQTSPTTAIITFALQDGEYGITSIYAPVNRTLPDLASVPTRTNYRFLGFFTTPEDDGTQLFDANGKGIATCPEEASIVAYARWEHITFTFDFKDIGGTDFTGTFSETEITGGNVGEAVTLPAPHRDGFTFVNWYDNAEGTGTPVTSVTMTETQYKASSGSYTAYAKWAENTP